MTNPFKTMSVCLTVAALLCESCYTKIYPDEKLTIDSSFSSLFNSVVQIDTLYFNNSSGRRKVFIVTKVDSIISNRKGLLINESPYKLIRSAFKEIGEDTVQLERQNEIFINKDPAKNENSLGIQFNNFYYFDTILPLLRHDSLNLNAKIFTNYYSFVTSLGVKNSDDVKVLYISVPNGFLGFKTLSGEVWVNEKGNVSLSN